MKLVPQVSTIERTGRYLARGNPDQDYLHAWFLLHDNQSEPRTLFRRFDSDRRLVIAPEALSRFERSSTLLATWTTNESFDIDISDNICYLNRIYEKYRPAILRADFRVLGHGEGAHVAWHWLSKSTAISRPSHFVIWDGFHPSKIDWKRSKDVFVETDVILVQENTSPDTVETISVLRQHLDREQIPYTYRLSWKGLFSI